jgi:3-dehydroquinate synthase
VLQRVVARNCAIKASVVEADEREGGQRAVLNFGHTIGHALEAALGYGIVTHGEAVARGMVVAAELSVRRGLCPPADRDRLAALLDRFGLLTAGLPPFEALEKYVFSDKKRRNGVLQFVLTRGVGSATFAPLSGLDELQVALRAAS